MIPDIIVEGNKTCTSHVATEHEYEQELLKKLLEETQEFNERPCIEEIADILEVLDALKILYGFVDKDIEDEKKKKFMERGGFFQRIILEDVYKND